MGVARIVAAGTRNALASTPAVDHAKIESILRRANHRLGRRLGRIEWLGSFESYIRYTAELMVEGWTVDDDYPLAAPERYWGSTTGSPSPIARLVSVEDSLWASERAAHSTARLTRSRRLPVYLNAITKPELASRVACGALDAAATASTTPIPREHGFAYDQYWLGQDAHWRQVRALAALPFLEEAARCYAAGLFAAASLRRREEVRTLLIARPRLRFREERLHADDGPAVLWPDGSERWYWDGIAVPDQLAQARHELRAAEIAAIPNQELRRVTLERTGWDRFLETADAELRAQDDYGKLWATKIRLDGEQTHLVEVVNSTAEPDGSYRRYFLRVPPTSRTARQAVAWTFGFDDPQPYLLAAES